MANDGFNGSTISFGAADQTPLLSITHDTAAAEIDVTGAADTEGTYLAGIPHETITFDVVGVSGLAVGATPAAVAIAWFDGTNESLTTGVCTNISVTGSIDDKITSSVTFKNAS